MSDDERGAEEAIVERMPTLLVVGLVLGAFLVACVLVIALALGMGWIATRFLPFDLFQATLICLVAVAVVGYAALQIVRAISSAPWEEDDLARHPSRRWRRGRRR